MESVEIKFVKGNRKHDLVEVHGHLFERNRPILNGFSYRCVCYHANSCKARVHVLQDGSVMSGDHTHPPRPESVLARSIISKAKESVKENRLMRTSQVLDQIENDSVALNLAPIFLGSTENVKRRIRHQRNKAFGDINLGESRGDLVIPNDLKKTIRGTQFLWYDNNGGDNRMLVFATEDAFDKLAYCETWLADGTFKSCPKEFYQVYTIHGIYRNTFSVPLVYAYLPNKSYETYAELFREVRRRVPGEPQNIVYDFELAAIQAGRDTFIASEISGCLFHLAQNIFKRVKENPRLLNRYNSVGQDGTMVRNAVRSLAALAFTKPNEVTHAFMELRASIGQNDAVRDVYTYFQSYYIGNDWEDVRFPIKFWNVRSRFCNAQPRTNNSAEGWHYRFNDLHSKLHPSMSVSIQMIRNEEKHYFIECQKIAGGLVPGRKAKTVAINVQLGNILQNHEAQVYRSHVEFLHAVHTCLHYFIQE